MRPYFFNSSAQASDQLLPNSPRNQCVHYITTLAGKTGVKPILLVFNPDQTNKVIGEFINVLDTHGLCDNKGIWKAIQNALRLNVRQSTIFDKFKKDRTFISVRFQTVDKPI